MKEAKVARSETNDHVIPDGEIAVEIEVGRDLEIMMDPPGIGSIMTATVLIGQGIIVTIQHQVTVVKVIRIIEVVMAPECTDEINLI